MNKDFKKERLLKNQKKNVEQMKDEAEKMNLLRLQENMV